MTYKYLKVMFAFLATLGIMQSVADAQVPGTGTDLSASDPAGTVGMYKGRGAIRVDLGGRKYVIATKNEGAYSEVDYGGYYEYDEALAVFASGISGYSASGEWRLPTRSELETFSKLPSSWTTRNEAKGRSFVVSSGKTLFLPADGGGSFWDDYVGYGGENAGRGYYWSSEKFDSGNSFYLYFGSGDFGVDHGDRGFGRAVRLFCALPAATSSGQRELTVSDPLGTKGWYKGREAIRVDLGGRKYVIAAKNEGANSEEDYGGCYEYDEALADFASGISGYSVSGEWRLPTRSELETFSKLPSSWTTRNGAKGRSFVVSQGKTLFLPADGGGSFWDDYVGYGGENAGRGYYWSSEKFDSGNSFYLYFGSGDFGVDQGDRGYGRAVRLFCALPAATYSDQRELAASDPLGTKGVYRGREAIRIDFRGRKYVIATKNEGAASETDYGSYYSNDESLRLFAAGTEGYSAQGVWRLPTRSELEALSTMISKWTTRNGVNGYSFSIASGKTVFLPAAGHVLDGTRCYLGESGYYCSSSAYDKDASWNFFISPGGCAVGYGFNSFAFSVRLVCALPTK